MIERDSKGRFLKGKNLGHPSYGGFYSRFKKGHKRTVESCKKCGGFISKSSKHECKQIWNKGLQTGIKPWLGKKRPNVSGKNHYRWKGGISPFEHSQRVKFRSEMQKVVFERDNYTCQLCESKKDLQVDHIQPWAEYIELRFNLDNCRTLCAECHYFITFGKIMPKNVRGWGHNFLKGGD